MDVLNQLRFGLNMFGTITFGLLSIIAFVSCQDTDYVYGDQIPGEAGIDYPVLSTVPDTGFTCDDIGIPGYYADPLTACQAYYRCHSSGRGVATLCPNGTIFNQETLVCDWWYNFDCSLATEFYDKNIDVLEEMARVDALNNLGLPDDSRTYTRNQRLPTNIPNQSRGLESALSSRLLAAGRLPLASGLGRLPLGTGLGRLPLATGLGSLPLGAGLGLLPLGTGLGRLPLATGLGSLPLGTGLGSLPLGAGLGRLPLGAGLGRLPLGTGLGRLPLGAGLGRVPQSSLRRGPLFDQRTATTRSSSYRNNNNDNNNYPRNTKSNFNNNQNEINDDVEFNGYDANGNDIRISRAYLPPTN